MKKLQRYSMSYLWNCYDEDDGGRLCMSRDVAELEAKYAKLEATNAQLLEVLEYVRAVLPPLVSLDNAKKMLDAAIAKAKEEPL